LLLNVREENSIALSKRTNWILCSGKFTFSLMTCVINLANAWLCVDRRHTCDHRVDVSIHTIKYLNGPDSGCIGPQISS
jgi:hypothetical protein